MADAIQLTSSRQLPSIYRRTFERQLLSFHPSEEKPDEEIELNHDFEQKKFDEITHELNTLSLDENHLYNLIGRTLIKINIQINGSKKLVRSCHSNLLVILCRILLGSHSSVNLHIDLTSSK